MEKLTPVKAIRKKCLECCGSQIKLVRECNIKTCPLWLYRMGHRPKASDLLSDDEKLKNALVGSEFLENTEDLNNV